MSYKKFLKIVLKDYITVGAVTISSRYVVRKVMRELKPEHKCVIEYGGGNGILTKEILKILPADGRLIVVELNDDFANELKQINDSRLKIIHNDVFAVAKDFQQLGVNNVDAVISSVPLSLNSAAKRKELIKNTYKVIREQGMFLVYQYSLLMLPELKKYFRNVRWNLELRNLLPYFIMVAEM